MIRFVNKLSFVYGLVFIVLFFVLPNSLRSQTTQDNHFETVKSLDVFYSLFKELNLYYVDPIVPGEIIKVGIDEMLKKLDPYTVYIPESQIEDIKFMTTGQYGGIGALIRKDKDYVVITETYLDSPSISSGLLPGDLILSIDGKDMKSKNSEQVSELLRGEPNTELVLKIRRACENKEYTIALKRKEIKLKSVPYYGLIDDKIGYIYLNNFTNDAASEVKEAYMNLKQNHHIESLVLDFRGNPGGLLNEAVKICNMFIEKGELIVSTKGKVSQWDKTYMATQDPIDTNIKLAVIVNSSSASASEIVAGAIQDLDRGVVIGQRTFGKGLVQTTRELSYNSMLKVTTAKYYIPSGRCIQAINYSHRDENGRAEAIPDSLVNEFKTKNGRLVYDGGGVTPDISIEIEYLSNLTTSLIIKNLIFDYAVCYKYSNQTISSPETFSFNDSDYNEFVKWLEDKDYDYQTISEKKLLELIDVSKNEKYYDTASNELEKLSKLLAHDKQKDLVLFKEEIKDALSREIVQKYYHDKGVIIYGLSKDDEIIKAKDVLKNEIRYNELLKRK